MDKDTNILLAFYGDDFTGSTDALEFLSRAGAKAVLFIEPPSPSQLANYPGLNAFGVAGLTRAMPSAQMEQTLLPAFEKIKQSGARHVHYKVCSTFDSSPHIGSIGKAIEAGAKVFKNKFIPLLVAAPILGRYCLFGNLFARMGIGSEGDIHRLDRHPSMSRHPVTPAEESDLRLQLAAQTKMKTGLLDITQLSKAKEQINTEIARLLNEKAEIILIDAVYQEQLLLIGELIDEQASNTLFSAGSSGIEMALGAYWNQQGMLTPVNDWKSPGRSAPLLIVSGSCSPVTAAQIEWAKANDFVEVVVDTAAICDDDKKAMGNSIWSAQVFLQEGKNVIIHTNGVSTATGINFPAEKSGTALGYITREIAAQNLFHRLVIAGGDTSSYAARAMGIESVEMIAPLVPGAPLCKASAPGSPVDGMEINFKGGQVGGANYFGIMLEGRLG